MLRMRDAVVAATLLLVTVLVAAVTASRQPPVVVEASASSRGAMPARLIDVAPAPPVEAMPAPLARIESPPPEVVPAPAVAANLSGNVRTRKFHRASCRYAGCANCTARFTNREDALAAGFDPGGCCAP
jgi:hypothetical protein